MYNKILESSGPSLTRINDSAPSSWCDLQAQVSKLAKEAGLSAKEDHALKVARGTVNIDVLITDATHDPPLKYLCECKFWARPIPQEKVHAFRSVLVDSGAHCGLMISHRGFQAGCFAAVENTNVMLLDWRGFERLVHRQWVTNYFCPNVEVLHELLNRLTEPMLDPDIRAIADSLNGQSKDRFCKLRAKWLPLTAIMLPYVMIRIAPKFFSINDLVSIDLPLRPRCYSFGLPDDVLDAISLRTLLESMRSSTNSAIQEFNSLLSDGSWPI